MIIIIINENHTELMLLKITLYFDHANFITVVDPTTRQMIVFTIQRGVKKIIDLYWI